MLPALLGVHATGQFSVSLDVPALLSPPGAENFGGALRPSPDTLWADICRFLAVSSTQAMLIARGFGMHRAPVVASKGFQSAPRRCRSTGLCRHQMDPRGCPSEDALWRPGRPATSIPARLLPELRCVAAIRLSIKAVWIVERSARFVWLVVRGSKVGIVPLQTNTSFFSRRKSWLRPEGGSDIGGPFYLLPGIINGSEKKKKKKRKKKKDDHRVMKSRHNLQKPVLLHASITAQMHDGMLHPDPSRLQPICGTLC
ncbi:uncharacterized protein LOC122171627 [Centrocercus urophasianus]|uniref:uncharacterized protein LOC122171627 n=1 Tax=Centrocercus urophasianus TaxID=9002 RepID=UPI001C64D860|nr:uncharacterized protein LOC122171627 [Centrocercus urophasianus]